MKQKIYVRAPKQRKAWDEILDNPLKTRILFHGGARSGKTDITLLWLVAQAAKYPGARILIARKHLDHARTTLFNNSLKKLLHGVNDFTFLESVMEIKHANSSIIRIAGLDDQDRVDKILGDEYLHIFINEATQISYDTMQTVITRLSQNVPGAPFRKLILDCNPKSQRHWLHRVGVQKIQPDKSESLTDAERWADLHWTPLDNPHLPPDYIESLKALTGAKRRRMLEGVWCDNEGAVYEEFDEDIHTFDPMTIPADWKRVRAIDFGYTNPFVCLWGAVDNDGRLYIYRERYLSKVLTKTHAEAIKAAESANFAFTVADHDAEERAELDSCGISTRAARKDVLTGIETVKKRLTVQKDGRPRLFISKSCVNLLSEFYDYVWEPPKEGRSAKEEPRKDRDHACLVGDTLITTIQGNIPIKDICSGMIIATRNGWNKILTARCTGLEEVFCVELSNGVKFKATGNHPVFILNKGFVSVDALRYNDIVFEIKNTKRKPVRIIAVTKCAGIHKVYNLAIENTPEYFAAGVLMHNCDALRYLCVELDRSQPFRIASVSIFEER